MKDFSHEILSHDPLHGYIPYVARAGLTGGELSDAARPGPAFGTPPDPIAPAETAEQDLIEHPWVQRMRQIRQLQTAWCVYPTAEHSRFAHILGVMHLASRAVAELYPSLKESFPDLPSLPCVDALARMAGLLHDVGHGPFGHFFDEHYLSRFGLTHETLGAEIIRRDLAGPIAGLRRTPAGRFAPGESISADDVAYLIVRPASGGAGPERPAWMTALRALFCGLYTVDNMDFVLRDAYMTGYSTRAFDIDRLLHYSFFARQGLVIHARGLPALVRFLGVRAELFRAVYFHQKVRGIDLELAELFAAGRDLIFPGDPREHWDDYLHFTEWSLLIEVARWSRSNDPRKADLGRRWQRLLGGERVWTPAAERTLFFGPRDAERASIFSNAKLAESLIRAQLPPRLANLDLKVDLARHLHRPGSPGPSGGQNFLYDPAAARPADGVPGAARSTDGVPGAARSTDGGIRSLTDHELYRQLPVSWRICRVYVRSPEPVPEVAAALDGLISPGGHDDPTNM